ncbi:MAG: hypothetical protein K0S47_3755 [Herbinix sp.]|jgi:vacuolar-type H+-ATPase subunit H|nr:hypothetical protein [Herbinix sp.]
MPIYINIGGERMAVETVQAVRKAEQKAAQMENDALIQRDLIIQEAKQKAKTMISSMTKDALSKAAMELDQTQKKGDELLITSRAKADKEILLMKELTKSKEQAAIKLILSEIV